MTQRNDFSKGLFNFMNDPYALPMGTPRLDDPSLAVSRAKAMGTVYPHVTPQEAKNVIKDSPQHRQLVINGYGSLFHLIGYDDLSHFDLFGKGNPDGVKNFVHGIELKRDESTGSNEGIGTDIPNPRATKNETQGFADTLKNAVQHIERAPEREITKKAYANGESPPVFSDRGPYAGAGRSYNRLQYLKWIAENGKKNGLTEEEILVYVALTYHESQIRMYIPIDVCKTDNAALYLFLENNGLIGQLTWVPYYSALNVSSAVGIGQKLGSALYDTKMSVSSAPGEQHNLITHPQVNIFMAMEVYIEALKIAKDKLRSAPPEKQIWYALGAYFQGPGVRFPRNGVVDETMGRLMAVYSDRILGLYNANRDLIASTLEKAGTA